LINGGIYEKFLKKLFFDFTGNIIICQQNRHIKDLFKPARDEIKAPGWHFELTVQQDANFLFSVPFFISYFFFGSNRNLSKSNQGISSRKRRPFSGYCLFRLF